MLSIKAPSAGKGLTLSKLGNAEDEHCGRNPLGRAVFSRCQVVARSRSDGYATLAPPGLEKKQLRRSARDLCRASLAPTPNGPAESEEIRRYEVRVRADRLTGRPRGRSASPDQTDDAPSTAA